LTAPELLAQVEARGAAVAVAFDTTGAACLKITPRGLVPDLLPDLARLKPALLELLQQPDARQLAREVTAARRGQWLCPSPGLLTIWHGFEAHFGQTITSQQIGAIVRFVAANEQLDNEELLTQIGALLRPEKTI
jgi:hypothetical protein